jgi:hypothetical protein
MGNKPNLARSSISQSVTDTNVTVGAVSTTVLAANGERTNVAFTNDSDETIYLARGATAEMNKGIRINANGGTYEIGVLNMYRGIVTGICASGGKNLCVSEGS